MSKKKSLMLSLIMVVVVGLSIVAGTFAYFQWTLNYNDGTKVNVTIEMGGIKMHIEPNDDSFVGLYPTAHCLNNVRYGDTLVRIENNTGALAIPSFKLKVAVNPSTAGNVDDYKNNIHYAVVALETNKDGSKKLSNGNVVTIGANTIDDFVTGTCAAPLTVSNTDDNDNTFKSDYGKSATGVFNTITAANTFADTAFLPREYNSSTGEVQGVTFRGEAYSTSYQWYRVYVWIDQNYTTTIVGNTVSDPLQNAKIEVTWSENSMLQQVSGESNVEEGSGAGLYDEDGNMVKTWSELLDDGDITVEENVITDSNRYLPGTLVIPEGIVEIGDNAFGELFDYELDSYVYSSIRAVYVPSSVTTIGDDAFYLSNLEEITFSSNSQLTTIGYSAFLSTSIRSLDLSLNSYLTTIGIQAFLASTIETIKLPDSLETIGDRAFSQSLIKDIIFIGTTSQWNSLELGDDWNETTDVIKVSCTDGIVPLVSGLFQDDGTYTSWDDLIDNGDITVSGTKITLSRVNLSGILSIPEGITEIGDFAFGVGSGEWGTEITDVYIPTSVTRIGIQAFSSSQLTRVIIAPNSNLTTIAREAFYDTHIVSINLPLSLTSIEEYAFSSCFPEDGRTLIKFEGTIAEWNEIEKGDGALSSFEVKVMCTDGEATL